MGKVRLKMNKLPGIISRLPSEVDASVDRAGDDLANDVADVVRVNTGLTARTANNYEEGRLHATVGVGVHGGAAFYVRFWELGWNAPNRYGIGPRAGDHKVQQTGEAFITAFASHVADGVRRAVR